MPDKTNPVYCVCVTQGRPRPRRRPRLLQAARRERRRTRRASRREPWRRAPATATRAPRPPPPRPKTPPPASRRRGPAEPERPTEAHPRPAANYKAGYIYCTVSSQFIKVSEKRSCVYVKNTKHLKVLFKLSGCCVCHRDPYESTRFPSAEWKTSPLQHILIHILSTMSGRSQVVANSDWMYEEKKNKKKTCHAKQTLFSVIFNFVFCIVVSLLLLRLLLHVAAVFFFQ